MAVPSSPSTADIRSSFAALQLASSVLHSSGSLKLPRHGELPISAELDWRHATLTCTRCGRKFTASEARNPSPKDFMSFCFHEASQEEIDAAMQRADAAAAARLAAQPSFADLLDLCLDRASLNLPELVTALETAGCDKTTDLAVFTRRELSERLGLSHRNAYVPTSIACMLALCCWHSKMMQCSAWSAPVARRDLLLHRGMNVSEINHMRIHLVCPISLDIQADTTSSLNCHRCANQVLCVGTPPP